MKKQVLCCIFIFCGVAVLAQDNLSKKKIDSLLILVSKAKVDTVEINFYQKICEELSKSDFVNIKKYNDNIYRLSKKSNYKRGWGYYYINLSAIEVYKNNEKSIFYAKQAKAFLKTENDNFHYLEAVRSLAFSYIANLQTKEAIHELEEHLPLLNTIDNNRLKISFYYCLGEAHIINSKYSKAIVALKKAIGFFNVSTKNDQMVAVYDAISAVYGRLEFYDESLNYLNQAQLACESVYNKNILYQHQVAIFLDMGLFDKAYPLAQKNYIFFNNFKGTFGYFTSIGNLALCNLGRKKYSSALSQFKITESVKDNDDMFFVSCGKIARCYVELKQFEKANDYIDKVIANMDMLSDNRTKLDAFLTKSDVEKALHKYESALFFHKKYASLSEQMNKTTKQEQVLVLQADLNITEKESKIKTMQATALQKNSQIEQQRRYLIYGGIGLVLALIGIVVFVKVYYTIKSKNKTISSNNSALESSVIEKEILLKEIHHRVKNNLQLVMSLLNIQSQEVDNTMADFLIVSQSRIISMSLIHESLYETENLSKVDFKAYVTKLTEAIVASQNNLHTDVQLKIEMDAIYFDIQTAIPLGLIINELVNNAYKHAFKQQQKGVITLSLKQIADSYELQVRDDGAGASELPKAKKSLGMELVQQLVQQINGLLAVQNNLGLSYNIQFKNQTISYEK